MLMEQQIATVVICKVEKHWMLLYKPGINQHCAWLGNSFRIFLAVFLLSVDIFQQTTSSEAGMLSKKKNLANNDEQRRTTKATLHSSLLGCTRT